ncbi:MAG TPA: hypothetical protein VFQ35_00265 [Polyangiaceae bacterium]|nr:hypothetical protein [Polyangiaceae bacterium]
MIQLRTGLAASALVLLGCASRLGSAMDAFEAGRLPEAAAEFRSLEPQFPRLGERDQARYALFFGLTELALGDLDGAERWLLPLKVAVEHDPLRLSDAERGALFAALRSTGRMPGE